MLPRLLILIGGHFATAPRPQKEVAATQAAGWGVSVIGTWWNEDLAVEDRELAARLGISFSALADVRPGSARRFGIRLRKRLAVELFRCSRVFSPELLGTGVRGMLKAARTCRADLTIVHSEGGLWIADRLQRDGLRVGVDMEDWFSEDLPPSERQTRPVARLRQLEAGLLRHANHRTCPSAAMSQALVSDFDCPAPAVVYNAFPWADRAAIDGQVKDRRDQSLPSLHWYSQTLGPGRGLEQLMAALPLVAQPAEIHLRGRPSAGFLECLMALAPAAWRKRIFVHASVTNAELLSRLAEHDVSFAGELPTCRSRDLTVTNKILHSLLGGLAVVASDTAGQREVAQAAGHGVSLYRSGDVQDLAEKLNALLGNPEHLNFARAAALAAARDRFSWEKQKPVLLESVRAAATEAKRK